MSNPFLDDVYDDLLVVCPECKEKTPASEWPDHEGTEVYCEDCGSHPGTACPKCDDRSDLVFCGVCAYCGRLQNSRDINDNLSGCRICLEEEDA